MKKTLKLALILGMMAGAEGAMAGSEGWYAGIGLGQSKINDWASKGDALDILDETYGAGGCTSCSFGAKAEDTDTGWKIFGGYQFHPNLAIEAAYLGLGEATAEANVAGGGDTAFVSAKAEATAITLDGVAKFSATEWLDIFAKLGVYRADLKVKVTLGDNFDSGIAGSESETDNSTGLHFGFGADFNVSPNVMIRAEWERLSKVDFKGSDSDIDLMSVSAAYKF